MITGKIINEKQGNPLVNQLIFESKNMQLYYLPEELLIANKFLPKRIYMNKKFISVFEKWMYKLLEENLIDEIKTFDGCFNVRNMRGLNTLSIHAYGLAVDFNARQNPLGLSFQQCIKKGLLPFSEEFIKVSNEFVDCGAMWKNRTDGMHFQLKKEDL